MDLSEILRSAPAVVAGGVAAVVTLVKAVRSLLEFYDDHLRKRHFKRYAYLLGEAGGQDDLCAFITLCKREDIFRSIFSHSTSPKMASAFMELYGTRNFPLNELRLISPYAKLRDDGSIVVAPSKSDIAGYVLNWLWFGYISVYFLAASIVVSKSSNPMTPFVWIGIVVLYALLTVLSSGGTRSFIAMRRVQAKLAVLSKTDLTLRSSGLPPAAAELKR